MNAARFARFLIAAHAIAALFAVAFPVDGAERPDLRRVESLILEGTNAFRRSADVSALASNAALKSAAADFAAYMARTDRYGHEADGRSPAQRATAHGYDYCIVLENIAYEQSSVGFETRELAGGLVDGWRRSPPHRRNMLDPAVTDIGVGVAHSGRTGRYYAVQLFGLPHSARISFSIVNRAPMSVRYSLGQKSYRLQPMATNTHEQCTPPRLSVRGPDGRTESTEQPKNGERFVVVPDGAGGVRLERR